MRLFLAFWSAFWTMGLPFIWLHRRMQVVRDAPDGSGAGPGGLVTGVPCGGSIPVEAIWLHLAGPELLPIAAPLIHAALAQGEAVVVTADQAAVRQALTAHFAASVRAGRLVALRRPVDLGWCYRRFFRRVQPKLCLLIERGLWPRMVQAAADAGLPLFLCNARYPLETMLRDRKFPLRPALLRRLTGVLASSPLQQARFKAFGLPRVEMAGELRFDLATRQAGAGAAGAEATARLRDVAAGRRVIVLALVAEAEEDLFLSVIGTALMGKRLRNMGPGRARPGQSEGRQAEGHPPQDLPAEHAPLFFLIPANPARVEVLAAIMAEAGADFARLAALRVADRPFGGGPSGVDVVLADRAEALDLALDMADLVVMGGGFSAQGCHDITPALARGKPVVVGPDITPVECPAMEAVAAGLCKQVLPAGLWPALSEDWPGRDPAIMQDFLATHGNASARSLALLAPWLRR